MKSLVKKMSVLSGISLLAFLFTGCEASKVAQCNSVVKTTNKYATIGKEFTAAASSIKDQEKAATTFNELGSNVSKLSTEVKGLEVKDEKLKSLQGRFASFYDSTATTFTSAGSAIQKKDLAALKKSTEEMKSIDAKEASLVSEINGYCKGK
jgi:hypothetical protein